MFHVNDRDQKRQSIDELPDYDTDLVLDRSLYLEDTMKNLDLSLVQPRQAQYRDPCPTYIESLSGRAGANANVEIEFGDNRWHFFPHIQQATPIDVSSPCDIPVTPLSLAMSI